MDLFRGADCLRPASLAILCIGLVTGCSSQGTIPPAGSAAETPLASTLSQRPASQAPTSNTSGVIAAVPQLQANSAKDLGAAASSTRLSVALTLRYRNQAQLDRLIAEQLSAGSQYHRWLTNEQFNATYAPSASSYQRVISTLQRAGFRIESTFDNRTVVDASGSVGTIERFFDTSIHRVDQAGYGERYLNVRPGYAPSALRDVLLNVDGLSTVTLLHTYNVRVTPAATRPAAVSKSPLFGPVSAATNYMGYGPLAFSAGYDLPDTHSKSGKPYNGLGRSSAIVIDADFAESDLRQFLAYFKVTRTGPATKRLLINGGPPQGDGASDSVEATLDAEALVGSAAGTALRMYEVPSLDSANVTDAYNKVVSDNAVDSVNSSFGACEAVIGTPTVSGWNAIAEQGAAKGITFHAATGDSGGGSCPSAPASSPYMTAVGGTTLVVGPNGTWGTESAWSGSGGGISTIFAMPAWQKGVHGVIARGRNLPDVAFDANPYTGMAMFYTASWNTNYNPLGGTSLASPLFGATVADIDQVINGRVGLGSSKLFTVWKAHGYGTAKTPYFHDIVQGNNGVFFAAPGYDQVSGIGSIDGWNLAGLL
jgi:kumamolisin